ncbi:hypothetical protein HOK09_04045 [Candidatus Woesearchaeota archaeon]|nr:hypothetical protein [Candidatus Woesearchaeota archaeon]
MSFNFNSLWLDWRAKVPDGTPNPSNAYHLVLLKELCLKQGIDTKTTDSVILFLEKKVDDEDVIKYKQDGESKEMKAGSAKTMDKEHPAKIEYDKLKGSDDEEEKEDKPEPMKIDPDGGLGPEDKEDDDIKKSDDKPKGDSVVAGDPNEGDNQVKNDMIKYGYKNFKKNTGSKPAPGGAGSAFNEIMSGEGVHILEQNPDMTEEEVAIKLYEMTEGSELGKDQKGTTGIGKKDMPDGFDGNENLFSKCLVSARSAKKKHERTQKRIKRLQEQNKFGEPQKTSTFYGAKSSIDAQVEMVKNAKTVLLPNGQVVNEEDATAFIKAGGGGMNPSDTATFVQDDDGNLLIQFHSDKTTTGDIQDNSTLIKEGENYKSYLEKEDLSEEERQQANDLIDDYSKKITDIEENYNKQAIPIAQKLEELPIEDQVKIIEEDKGTIKQNIDYALFGKKGIKSQYEQHLNGRDPEKLSLQEKYEIIRKHVSSGQGAANDTKVVNKVGEALLKQNPEVEGLNVKKNLSDQREKVVGLQRERVNKLNEIKDGLGISMEANEAERAFHLEMMDYPPKEYEEGNPKSLMGASLDVNMGGNIVNGEVLRGCLGVENTKEFKERFRLVENDELTYAQNDPTVVTGKNVFTYAIDTETNERIEIGFKTYRSKDGAAGKTNNTMTYSKDMQNCFKSKN